MYFYSVRLVLLCSLLLCIFTSQVAEIMNEHFINVKVDREERPDVDKGCKTFQPRIFQTQESTSTMNSSTVNPACHELFNHEHFNHFEHLLELIL